MSSPVFVVHGGRELRRTFKEAGQDLSDLKAVNKRVGDVIADAARSRAPIRTGRLAASLRPAAAAAKVTVRAGGSSLRYAGPIHWGWPAHHIAANPFISEAATSTEPTWLELYFRELQDIVDGVKGA
ncbi:hypothetical protein [Cellulomonas sp. URHB0016]